MTDPEQDRPPGLNDLLALSPWWLTALIVLPVVIALIAVVALLLDW